MKKNEQESEDMGLKGKLTGTATYESKKDKDDAKEYSDMRKAKEAYFEERSKRIKNKKSY